MLPSDSCQRTGFKAAIASQQSSAAWPLDAGSPSSAVAICTGAILPASVSVLPTSMSVITDAAAIAGTHPCALKRAAVMAPPSIRIVRRSTSPQTGFVTSARCEASASSPALCGSRKWARILSLNIRAQYKGIFLHCACSRNPTKVFSLFLSIDPSEKTPNLIDRLRVRTLTWNCPSLAPSFWARGSHRESAYTCQENCRCDDSDTSSPSS